jgi:hypothetical protein
MLKPTQPDLIYPVRCLTRLNTDLVISFMLQFDGNGIFSIACPTVDTYRMNIQPVPQPNASGVCPDLFIHLQPYRIGIAAINVAFAS